MNREDAIEVLKESKRQNEVMRDNPSVFWKSDQMACGIKNAVKRIAAIDLALSALRPVSREQVEKAWPECDCCEIPCDNCKSAYKWDTHGLADECVVCRENGYKNYTPESQFCEFCGRPLTDEAVEMVMERLEALNEED